jgi:hypothetical protein
VTVLFAAVLFQVKFSYDILGAWFHYLRSARVCSQSMRLWSCLVCSFTLATSSWMPFDKVLPLSVISRFSSQYSCTHIKSFIKAQLMSDFSRSIRPNTFSTSFLVNFHNSADLIWSLFLDEDDCPTMVSKISFNWSSGPFLIPSNFTWLYHGSSVRVPSTRKRSVVNKEERLLASTASRFWSVFALLASMT